MVCARCGEQVREGVGFCGSCGARIERPAVARPPLGTPAAPVAPAAETVRMHPSRQLISPPPGFDPPTGAATSAVVRQQPIVVSPPTAGPAGAPPAASPVGAAHVAPPESQPVLSAPPATASAPHAVDEATHIAAPRRRRWALRLPDGSTHDIDGPLVVGRDPRADLATHARLVRVADPDGTVSRSHAVIEPTETGVRVRDISTNGVVVLYPDGRGVEVLGGADLELGGACEIELGALAVEIVARD